jgi:hypothetical protein
MKQKFLETTLWLFAILGLAAEFGALFTNNYDNAPKWIFTLIYFVKPFQLYFFKANFLRKLNLDGIHNLDLFGVFFLVLMLLAALFYTVSKGRETRLAAFLLAIIFLNQLAAFLFFTSGFAVYVLEHGTSQVSVIYVAFSILKPLLFLFLSYRLLKSITIRFEPIENITVYDTVEIKDYEIPSGWVRAFHQVVDIMLLVLMYSIFVFSWTEPYLEILGRAIGERLAMVVYFAIVGFLYYPISEILFGATPAKLLTNTTVLDEEGGIASKGNIFLRTLFRHIPLEALSFLGNKGWHDKFSKTQVVYLKNTGIAGGIYLLIFPGLFLSVFAGLYANDVYEQNKIYASQKAYYNEKVQTIEKGLAQLSNKSIIAFQTEGIYQSSTPLYFKIERIENDNLLGVYLPIDNYTFCSNYSLEIKYREYIKTQPALISIPLNQVKTAFCKEYSEVVNEKRCGINLPDVGSPRVVEEVIEIGGTQIKSSGTGGFYNEGDLSLGFYNDGWPGSITRIRLKEGALNFNASPMQYAPTTFGSKYPDFTLAFSNYKYGTNYEFEMDITDSAGNIETYKVVGKNMENMVTKLAK